MEKKKTVQGKKLELESWKSEEEGGRGDLRFLYSFDTLFDSFSFYEASNSRHYLDCFVPCTPHGGVSRRGRNNFPFELAPRESFHNHDPRDRILLYRSDRAFRFESRRGSWYNSKIGHP